jgi:MGT family glycosyltransferase
MPSQHILFISVQGHGHVYPSLEIVSDLVRRGYRVSYVTTPLFTDEVTAAGARVLHYTSEFDTFHVPDVVGRDDAEAQIHMVYVRENVAILRAAAAALTDDVPDLVVYDVFPFIAGRLLATAWHRPAVRLSPIFAANEHYSIFEALWRSNGFSHPAQTPAVHEALTDLLAGYGIGTPIREFWDAIEDLNIVLIPRTFQIAEETFDERFVFVGPMRTEQGGGEEWEPPSQGAPVLLASLGNQFNEHPEFFRACADAFAGTEWHVVMAVGGFLDLASLGPLPGNVEVHRWTPFGPVLKRAAACLTQGTTGAVMTALACGVPLVVVPHFATEAAPSADRVVELGLGYRLAPELLTPDGIRSAVVTLAGDDLVRQRVRQMQQDISDAGGASRAATAIIDYLERAHRHAAGS